jgi:probable phosphoglycerate mutase
LTTPDAPEARSDQARVQDRLEALFRLDDEDADELLLVRHAEPAGAPDLDTDPMLSCEGLRQAERLANRLSGLWIDAVYTAPERRCFQTAKVIADVLQRPLTVTEGLSDVPFDPAEARGGPAAYAQRFTREPRWDSLPGFGDGRRFRRRAVVAIDGIVAAHPARRAVVVSHAAVLNAYLSMLLCIPRDLFFAPDHASVSTVRHRDDLYGLRGLNDTAHLRFPEGIMSLPPAFTPRSLPLTNR